MTNKKTFKKKVKDLSDAKKVMDDLSKNLIERVELEHKRETEFTRVTDFLKKVNVFDNYFGGSQKTLQQESEDHLE